MSNLSAVLYGSGDLRIEERPEPRPKAGQVIVEVEAVGICGSDIHYYEHGRIGDFVVEEPMVVGHEAAGTVIEVGEDVDPTRIGELVAIEPGVPDFTCEQCLSGRYNLCPKVRFFATPPIDGAITCRVAAIASFAHRAPDQLDAEQAAMAEPVSVGVWACKKAGVTPGDRVLVTGAGPIGIFAAQVARSFGAADVTLTDTNNYRRDVADRLGFATFDATKPVPGEYQVLIECSGVARALTEGVRRLSPGGRAVLVGAGSDTATIEVPIIQSRELTIAGIFRYANTYRVALGLIATGKVNVSQVITHRFPLEHTREALTLAHNDPRSLKAIVKLR